MRGHIADIEGARIRLGLQSGVPKAAVLAGAYRRFGTRLARDVLGEFCGAIVDRSARSVVLVHDALGLMPLFYGICGDTLHFATHLASITASLGAGDIDEEYLADFLAIGHAVNDRTPYKRIKRLMPGEAVLFKDGTLRRERVWSLATVACEVPANVEEQAARLSTLLTDAVRASSDFSECVWVELSGGLDSSTVASLAARERDVQAVSIVYPQWPLCDERRYIDAAAAHAGIRVHTLDGCTLLPFSVPSADSIGEPSQFAYVASLMHAYDDLLHANGVDVLLTGMGGDEVLCSDSGLPHHLSDAAFNGRPLTAFRDVATWRRGSARSWLFALRVLLFEPAMRHLRGKQVWRPTSSRLPNWIDATYRRTMALDERCTARVAPRCATPGRQLLADTYTLMALSIGNRAQRGQRYAIRHPLLYKPLVEFMACVPVESSLSPSEDRMLHRRAMRGTLPDVVRLRTTKSGGTMALTEGLRRSTQWFAALYERPEIVERGIVNRERWRLALQQARLGHTQGDRYLMAGVSLEAWFTSR